jgi:site-specific DNA-methyltransferase (adenine-specific)
VFLREITSRLTKGLAAEIPDLQKRVDHILTKQVFGIGITYLTSLLARRSLYCSKDAKGPHSIAEGFANDAGNIWFERMEHTWMGEKCAFCGAGRTLFDRGEGLETHAYFLIHTDSAKAIVANIFGEAMQFDVVVGNPPYQIEAEGNTRTMPIYQKFVDAAISLDPKYLVMITPSRWFAGGLGLDDFRENMLTSGHLRALVDYPDAGDVFPGVEIKGGVSYFLWDKTNDGTTTVVSHTTDSDIATTTERRLDEFDVHIRHNEAVPILRRVLAKRERSLSEIVSPQKPFGLQSNQNGASRRTSPNQVALYGTKQITYLNLADIPMNKGWVPRNKVLVSEAYGASDSIPHQIIGKPFVVGPRTACTQTYLVIGLFNSTDEAQRVRSYLSTRFARFLISLRKITQHTKPDTYLWVPQQTWDRNWTDEMLYEKYGITKGEIAFIDRMIRPGRG